MCVFFIFHGFLSSGGPGNTNFQTRFGDDDLGAKTSNHNGNNGFYQSTYHTSSSQRRPDNTLYTQQSRGNFY